MTIYLCILNSTIHGADYVAFQNLEDAQNFISNAWHHFNLLYHIIYLEVE